MLRLALFLFLVSSSLCLKKVCSKATVEVSQVQHSYAEDGMEVWLYILPNAPAGGGGMAS